VLVALARRRQAGVVGQGVDALRAQPGGGLLDLACATGNRRCRLARWVLAMKRSSCCAALSFSTIV
jgi:hypothetical protein